MDFAIGTVGHKRDRGNPDDHLLPGEPGGLTARPGSIQGVRLLEPHDQLRAVGNRFGDSDRDSAYEPRLERFDRSTQSPCACAMMSYRPWPASC